jgi:tRNA pseudouridine55 synthase
MSGRATDGILLVDKAAGMTSHDVVALARRALGTRRIGHAGTLDPFATGLLVLLVGNATRLLPYAEGDPKVYEATIRFGVETDTADPTGAVVREAPLPSEADVAEAMTRLTGAIDQVPPAYSAKQVKGVRAYAAARRGDRLELAAVQVTVDRWEILGRRPGELDVRIVCGGGTYIRSLARDLGALSGSAAHLVALRRVRAGHFDVGDAITTDQLRRGAVRVRPPRDVVPSLPAEILEPAAVARVALGQSVPATLAGERAALVATDGDLIAIAERCGEAWQPRVVLRTS